MAVEHVQKACLHQQDKERPQASDLVQLLGKKKEAVSPQSGVLKDQEKAHKIKNSATKGSRNMEQIYPLKV